MVKLIMTTRTSSLIETMHERVIVELKTNNGEWEVWNSEVKRDSITGGDILEFEEKNYDLPRNPITGGVGDLDIEVKLTASAGYMFDPESVITNSYGTFEGTDERILTYTIGRTGTFNLIPNHFTMLIETGSGNENFPYSNIYEVSRENLEVLANYNFVETIYENSDGGLVSDLENYGKYVTSLYYYPFTFDELEEENILLGDLETTIPANIIPNNLYSLDMGDIEIPYDLARGTGYKNIEIDVYIPNFGNISLDVDEVLGETINIKMIVNLITGIGTINIYNYNTNSTIVSETTQIGVSIPYEFSNSRSVNIGSNVTETEYKIPYVELKVLKPNNEVELDYINIVEIDTDFNYIKDSDDLLFSTVATEREQKLIKDMVARGVFVRK